MADLQDQRTTPPGDPHTDASDARPGEPEEENKVTPNTIDDLLVQLETDDYWQRDRAAHMLIELGTTVIEPLSLLVQSGRGPLAIEAARILARIHDGRCTALMEQTLRSGNPLLAEIAAEALARQRVGDVVALFLQVLPTAHQMVQFKLVTLLQALGDRRAVLPLLELLPGVQSHTLRYTIIEALGALGDPVALPTIRAYLDDENHHVRKRAQMAIERLENNRRRGPLH